MDDKLIIRPAVLPLPYHTVTGSIEHTLLAKSLCSEFVTKIRRNIRIPRKQVGDGLGVVAQ